MEMVPFDIALPTAEVATTRAFLAEQMAPATRRAYRSDARIFAAWCEVRGVSAMPASPETVATFLAHEAEQGTKFATISRRCAAINYMHGTADRESPTKARLVAATLKGIRRSIGVAKTQKAPATASKIAAMAAGCGDDLRGLRDRALLLLGFAGAFRRSELVALTAEDLAEEAAGMRVTIRRSKTDKDGAGAVVAIARGQHACPVEAVKAWLTASGIKGGPIFRGIRNGRLMTGALSCKQAALVVKGHAAAAGLNPDEYAGHSLRAGFLTSAAEAGANIFRMAEHSRHKTLDVLRGYVRNAELFKNHAGAGLL